MMNREYILMLEPSANDRDVCAEYFGAKNIPAHFLTYSNEVMSYLTARLISRQPLPRVILLSLHSTPENGLFVLQEIKDDDNFKHIPVVMIGENADDNTVKRCYEYGANSFINESFGNAGMEAKINSFLNYWFEIAVSAEKSRVAYS